ncbi:pancreatic lipase-related protein 2-like protein [Dinothrombium tinctorium]|uniref:Pancreatic lipase-related protein 2-like protein n=1 Tax=Dinothrombium tinctorium TaxID=1965070 RepID=A0A3S3QWJ2_9ACAR|nr:pancreatic lipase-related protein 2-like protein [Dinothrombium tinctorium]
MKFKMIHFSLITFYLLIAGENNKCDAGNVFVDGIGCLPNVCGCDEKDIGRINNIYAKTYSMIAGLKKFSFGFWNDRKNCTSPKLVETVFLFYNNASETNRKLGFQLNHTLEGLEDAPFNKDGITVFMSHGYLDLKPREFYDEMRDLYLNKFENVNFILVDYSDGSMGDYWEAVANIQTVAYQTAFLVEKLMKTRGLNVSTVRMMAGSLGGQMFGLTGRAIQELTGVKAAEILVFDPASPCFEFEDHSLHINSSDASSVILVHSNMGNFGTTRLSGTVDFCPNGGRDQPYDCEHWTCKL